MMDSKIRINAVFFVMILYTVTSVNGRRGSHSNRVDLNKSFGEVIYTQILFRHGDRTPSGPYPTDPNRSFEWKEGNVQLTNAGKLQAYELGKWVRRHYAHLIENYKYDAILINSSDTDRTLMSAEAFLAGMYPPSDAEMWNTENLRWQPIPVHSTLQSLDIALSFNSRPCERYDQEKDALNQDPAVIALYKKHQHTIRYVSVHSEVLMLEDDVLGALTEFENVYDTLSIEGEYGLTIPSWARDVLPQPMKSIADLHYSMLAPTIEMQRIKGGPLLKSIIDDMKEKVDGNLENRTFHIYSGHSKGVVVLLETLEIFHGVKPPYSTAVIIELRKKDNFHYVSVLYRNSSLVPPHLLRIPGCRRNVCTLDEFIRVTASKIPDDWDYECVVGVFAKLFYNFGFIEYFGLGVGVVALVGVLIKLIFLIIPHVTRWYKKRIWTYIPKDGANSCF